MGSQAVVFTRYSDGEDNDWLIDEESIPTDGEEIYNISDTGSEGYHTE